MWHEARRQERKIRGLMVDFKKRADRRREYYEKIKMDPTQFLRVYGRPYKINFDPAVAIAAESPQSMMPWQGDTSNMIDRFDVRAHLDYIPEAQRSSSSESSKDDEEEDSLCNYERYRTLVENDASGLTEEQCLNEIYIDEHFGPPVEKKPEEEKKKSADKKAAIAYTYEDSTPVKDKEEEEDDDSDDESSDTDVETADLDVTLDVDQLTQEQEAELNIYANQYGMRDQDFVKLLRKDKDEVEALKYAKQMEEEKAQFSGRKSRRERRAFKEKQLQGRRLSPPSYAARSSPKYEPYKRAGSSSRSRSPEEVGQVKFITSFGAESDDEGASGAVQGPSLPPAHGIGKSDSYSVNDSHSDKFGHHSWKYRSRPSHLRGKRSHSKSRSRSRSPRQSLSRRRSDSRNVNRRDRRSRSRSRSGRPWDSRDQDARRGRYERERNSVSSYGRSRFNRSGSRSLSRGHRRSRSRSQPRSQSKTGSRNSRSKSSSSRSRSSRSSRSMSASPKAPPVIKRYRRDSLSSKSSLSSDEDNKDSAKDKGSTKESGSAVKNTPASSSSRNKSGAGSTLLGKGGGDCQVSKSLSFCKTHFFDSHAQHSVSLYRPYHISSAILFISSMCRHLYFWMFLRHFSLNEPYLACHYLQVKNRAVK